MFPDSCRERTVFPTSPARCLFRQTCGCVGAAKPGFSSNRAFPVPPSPPRSRGVLPKTKEQMPLSRAMPALVPRQAWSVWKLCELRGPGLALTSACPPQVSAIEPRQCH